jgi:hypothetical protein
MPSRVLADCIAALSSDAWRSFTLSGAQQRMLNTNTWIFKRLINCFSIVDIETLMQMHADMSFILFKHRYKGICIVHALICHATSN